MDQGMYNPILAETRHLEARRNQCPRLKMTDERWNTVKPQLEKRWSPEKVEKAGVAGPPPPGKKKKRRTGRRNGEKYRK
jgi:IS30 family transposase